MNTATYFATRIALTALLLMVGFSFVQPAYAANDLEYSGWIPYWQDTLGTKSATKHLNDLSTLHPFVFSVKSDGSLNDLGDIEESRWKKLFRAASRKDVEVIPTVMWSSGTQIHAILSNPDLREEHIAHIVEMVEDGDFNGVDIDYESKLADTIDHFSAFLEELKDELGSKTLTCTIEARTPPEDRYRTVPVTIEYANDYEAIAAHCDRVEIMGYDQQRIDWRLNDEKSGQPYIPVADVDWVEKVVKLTLEDIPAEKIMLGVPTYGRQWTITVAPNWYKEYTNVSAVNLPDAEELADDYDVTPGRNRAGELSFSFFPESSMYKVLRQLPVPEGTPTGNEAAAQALLFANLTGMTVPVNVVWYSDAVAIKDKIDLAQEYGLRGIAIFKIDGEEDPELWDMI